MKAITTRVRSRPNQLIGTVIVATTVLLGVLVFQRSFLVTTLTPGDTITAVFERDYRLRDYVSEVKVAGVVVGTVTGVDETSEGMSEVSMKLDGDVVDRLGTAPSAAIRPSTLLGGKYYVELTPGGGPGAPEGAIPVERTRIAVELDAVVETLQPEAREGIRQFTEQVDETLKQDGGAAAVKDFLAAAPGALRPSAPVLTALSGERPEDLRTLISGLDDTARVLNAQEGQLDEILTSLDSTAGALDRERVAVGETVGELPATLRSTRSGMTALRGSLDRLTDTAADLEPSAEALDPLLADLEPVLVQARPIVADLRELLTDARPLVDDLVPTAQTGTRVLDDLSGPVLDRVNGPILDAVNSTWDGAGPYEGNGSDYFLYQDIAFMFTNANAATKFTDDNGAGLTIQAGQGGDAFTDVAGLPNPEGLINPLLPPEENPR